LCLAEWAQLDRIRDCTAHVQSLIRGWYHLLHDTLCPNFGKISTDVAVTSANVPIVTL
jgi:hypothetical protein